MNSENVSLTVPFLRDTNRKVVMEIEIVEIETIDWSNLSPDKLFIIRMKGISHIHCNEPFFSYSVPVPDYFIKELMDALADLLYRDKPLSWSAVDPWLEIRIPVTSVMSDTFEPLIHIMEHSSRNSGGFMACPELIVDKSCQSNIVDKTWQSNLQLGIDIYISGYETPRESLEQIREFLAARLLNWCRNGFLA